MMLGWLVTGLTSLATVWVGVLMGVGVVVEGGSDLAGVVSGAAGVGGSVSVTKTRSKKEEQDFKNVTYFFGW